MTDLKRLALIHPSARVGGLDNQRLEFLGNAVVGLAAAEYVFAGFPADDEGRLTLRWHALIREEALAEAARRSGLQGDFKLGKGEEAAGGRELNSNLADLFEAMAAAFYLEDGWEAARGFILRGLAPAVEWAPAPDPKNQLQERLQAGGRPVPAYRTVAVEGPDHSPRFTVEVLVGERCLASGTGGSKQAAERAAAVAALERLDTGP